MGEQARKGGREKEHWVNQSIRLYKDQRYMLVAKEATALCVPEAVMQHK